MCIILWDTILKKNSLKSVLAVPVNSVWDPHKKTQTRTSAVFSAIQTYTQWSYHIPSQTHGGYTAKKKSLCHQGVTTNNYERNWYIVVFQYTISFLDLTYWQLKFWWENISLAFDFGPCLVWVEDFFCHVGDFEFLNSY